MRRAAEDGRELTKTPGVGQVCLGTYKDKNGDWLDCGKTYRLRVAPNAPVANFWSLTIYDTDMSVANMSGLRSGAETTRSEAFARPLSGGPIPSSSTGPEAAAVSDRAMTMFHLSRARP